MASEKPVADPELVNTPPAPTGSSSSPAAPPTIDAAQVPLPESTVTSPAPTTTSLSATDAPNRPLTPNSAARATLQEAFPNIEASVIRAVLIASGGRVEPAFNALLTMSDPNAVEEEMPPPQPPRAQSRSPRPYATTTPQTQLDADAELALRLQQEYNRAQAAARPRRQEHGGAGGYYEEPVPPLPARRHHDRRGNNDSDEEYYRDDDRDHSFFDDDLPVIKDNIKKGFLETQSKVNSWLTEFKKKLDGESPENTPPTSQRPSSQYARAGSRRSYDTQGRRSMDNRHAAAYDADPAVLSDDFTHLAMKDNTTDGPQNRRPKANPNLFQPTATSARKVSFDDRTTTINDDDDLYRKPASPARGQSPANAGVGSKWKPLQSVEPAPLDRDPFSLGDSDDEKDGLMKEGEPTKSTSVTSAQESGTVDKSK
ncbi:hypothetical protein EX30DRAFT_339408 [Ascodesmis nigricans]|uniref:CUE domain-containing protein n=1 Tax=Ascodesmis nigricans TaxID=341454 RepID=A0A4S2N271_9PEZI|nr:hypothetical protein EX30DRAFT_339408 [Ascodesmis nigricans]